MAKQILNIGNGALILQEDGGVFSLLISDQVSVGGGAAAGLIKAQGSASVTMDAMGGLKLGESLLNAHLPASVAPLASVVEGIANQALAALE